MGTIIVIAIIGLVIFFISKTDFSSGTVYTFHYVQKLHRGELMDVLARTQTITIQRKVITLRGFDNQCLRIEDSRSEQGILSFRCAGMQGQLYITLDQQLMTAEVFSLIAPYSLKFYAHNPTDL